jgi:hypothetical protein
MSGDGDSMAKTNLLDRILRAVLIGVAAFDLLLGFAILCAPQALARVVNLPLPAELYYVRLLGLLQIGLALAYLLGGSAPARYFGNVALAAVLRLAMGTLLIIIGSTAGLPLFTVLGVVEIPLGLAHAFYATRIMCAAGRYVL